MKVVFLSDIHLFILSYLNEVLLNLRRGNHICADTESSEIAFKDKFQEIFNNVDSTELWCSSPKQGSVNSFQWWSHILDYNPLQDFLNFKVFGEIHGWLLRQIKMDMN